MRYSRHSVWGGGRMINIAIVEDEKAASDLIVGYLTDFGKKTGEEFNVTVFRDAVAFLDNYKPVFDLVFMDILMPNMDGMRAAHKLREVDNFVLLIFITNMGDYAVKGYDVGAIAFIKKPVAYYDFELKMKRAIFTIRSRDEKAIMVSSSGNRFALKFTLSNLIVLVASLLLTLLYYYIEYAFNSSLIASLRVIITYLIMFAMAVGAMKFSYKEPLLRCLSAGAAGYICQHISYNFYSIINESANLEYSLIVRLGLAAYLLCMLIQLACAAAVLTVCYFAFAKRVNKLSAESTVRRNVLFIVICSLGIVILLSSIGYALSSDSIAVSILLKCMQIVCCVFLMVIYLNIFEVKEAKNELAIVLKLNENEHAHFLKLKQDMELISVKCHDIKQLMAN